MMSQNEEKNQQCIFPKLGMIYGMCAQSKHNKLSAVQRVTTLYLLDNIADQKVLTSL